MNATETDAEHILNLAKGLGIPEDHIYINNAATRDEVNSTYKEMRLVSKKLNYEKRPHTFLVYAGGHGASTNEQQLYLLNGSNAKATIINLEYKLRYLVKDEESLLKVFAIYDCCRVELKNIVGLAGGRAVGVDGGNSDEDDSDEEPPCQYFHITACGPGGIADADAGFAERVLKFACKSANKAPKGFI